MQLSTAKLPQTQSNIYHDLSVRKFGSGPLYLLVLEDLTKKRIALRMFLRNRPVPKRIPTIVQIKSYRGLIWSSVITLEC
jgi:hypothetical protein